MPGAADTLPWSLRSCFYASVLTSKWEQARGGEGPTSAVPCPLMRLSFSLVHVGEVGLQPVFAGVDVQWDAFEDVACDGFLLGFNIG